ncbi:MAG: SurA N-terminal domain-containing protein, partial [Candidatus Contendobacter sp.]|nr:SurA N-terminal domain-containing protein [Candidatus Contendobacter sp.]
MKKLNKLTFPLLALSSTLMLSSMALAAEDKKTEAAPTAAPAAAAPDSVAQPAAFTIPDPVATVNGAPISKAAFDQYAQQLRGKAKVDSAEASKSLVDQLVLEELLVQEAN